MKKIDLNKHYAHKILLSNSSDIYLTDIQYHKQYNIILESYEDERETRIRKLTEAYVKSSHLYNIAGVYEYDPTA